MVEINDPMGAPPAPLSLGAAGTPTAQTRDSSNSTTNQERESRRGSASKRARRWSANDGAYPYRGQNHSLSTVDEAPSRDPQDTAIPTPTSTVQSTMDTDTSSSGPDYHRLSRPATGTRDRLEESEEEAAVRMEKLTGAVRTILECVGENVEREGLLKTPKRYADAMMFFTKGYEQNLRDIVNEAIFNEDHDEMVIVKDIEIQSMCEHHLVPFIGRMHIGYIPAGRVLGLSKFARIAEMFARRFQVQERLTKQVAEAINEVLEPQGVAVVVESSHLCMVMRGVQQTQSKTTTSCMLGALRSRDRTRAEFLTLIRQ